MKRESRIVMRSVMLFLLFNPTFLAWLNVSYQSPASGGNKCQVITELHKHVMETNE
jgi:hypothetical protein